MPGSIVDNMPPRPDDPQRRTRDIQRKAREDAASQRAAFDTTIAQITALINTQVVPAVASSSASNYALTTTAQELTRVTFTVPAGYTQAQVTAIGSMSCFNESGTTADQIWGYVDINGSTPAAQPGWTPPASGGNTASSYALLLTGLAAGATFYARFVGYNRFGNTGVAAGNLNTCTLNAQVLFLR